MAVNTKKLLGSHLASYALVLLFSTSPALASDSSPQPLFGDIAYSTIERSDIPKDTSPEIIRSRMVSIDFSQLATSDVMAKEPGQKKLNLRLHLFPDMNDINVSLDEIASPSQNTFAWNGIVDGYPDSEVTFIKNRDILQGNIRWAGKSYQIRYLTHADGISIHSTRQIDESKLPPEHPQGYEEGVLQPQTNQVIPEDTQSPFNTAADDGSVIDVMVVYTPSARSAVGGTSSMQALINLAVVETNDGYNNSGVVPRINLVHQQEVSYTESGSFYTDLSRLQGKTDGYMDNVHTLRNTYGADMVALLINNSASCGLAYTIMATESQAFHVTHYGCATGYYSFAHEFGHLQGARHDWAADPTNNSPYPYNHGYVNTTNAWRTIMAYNNSACSGGYCTRLKYWSNPNVLYGGNPMGVPDGSSQAAENWKTLNNTAYTAANWRASVTPPMPGAPDDFLLDFLPLILPH